MQIFVTGGTGFIGRAVVGELTTGGHVVHALVRSPDKAPVMAALGALPLAGDLREPDSYEMAARAADAVVHIAYDYATAADLDRMALDTLLAATEGRDASFLYTSGLWVLGDTGGETVGDDAPTDHPSPLVAWRVPHERRVLASNDEGRTAAVIRIGHVYGGGGGVTARMFQTASRDGAAEYIGDGTNRWSNIYLGDLARLYRLMIEQEASGVYHAVDGVPQTVAAIASAASRAAGAEGATKSVPLEEARERLGEMADAMCLGQLLSAPAARALGWTPEHASFTSAADVAFEEWREATTN